MPFHLSKISLLVLAVIASRPVLSEDKSTQKDENDIEKLIITASPLGRSILQSSTPVSILSGEALEKNQSATLGETLKSVPGVNSTYFGPVASSPIIRGLDGPRVKVVQNGMDSSDASRVGPDHN
jgi:iron complex outermembrane receptor protein